MNIEKNREKLQRLQHFLQQDPQNIHIMGEIAFIQYTSGELEDARQSALKCLSLSSSNPLPHTLLGLIAADAENYEEACLHFAQAQAVGEQDPYIYFKYAQALSLLGKHVEAEPLLEEAIKDTQRAPHAELLLVRVLHYLGKLDEAIAIGERAIAEGRSSPQLYSFMATLYIDNNDLVKAKDVCRKALESDPDNPEALTVQSILQLNEMETDHALEGFKTAIASQPRNGRAHLGEGLTLMLLGNMPDAISSMERATSFMPSHVGTLHALAWCHILQKNLDAAEQALQQAYDLDHNFGETHGGLAIVALMKGQLESAKKYAQQAKRLGGSGLSTQFVQALIQQSGGNNAKAQEIMENLMSSALLPDGQSIRQAVARYLAKT